MHSKDRLAALGHLCALYRLGLSASTGPRQTLYRLGRSLTVEIDFQRCIDGNELVVQTDRVGVISVGAGFEQNSRVVVDIVIQSLTAHSERTDRVAVVQPLLRVIHCAALDQIHHGLRKHLRMNAEVLFLLQFICHCIRNIADAKLDGGTILNQISNVPTNGSIRFRIRSNLGQRNGIICFHDCIHLRNVNQRITKGAWEIGVYLHQDQCAIPNQIHLIDCAYRKAHIAMIVHGGDRADHDRTPVLVFAPLERFT